MDPGSKCLFASGARASWKGYLKLSLVSCPIALYPAASTSERDSFNRINKKTGNRLKQQLIDAETGETVEREDIGRGYELGKGQYLQVEDEEIEKIRIESSHTISIDTFVPRTEIDDRYLDDEQLSMFGLIEAREGLYGFRDLAAARQVAQLLGSGIGLSVITRSLRDIRKWLPDAGLSNLRLFPESSDKILVEQVGGRTDSKGQFVLPVEKPNDADADEAFAQAQSAEEAGDSGTAESLYRRVMKLDPKDPAAGFNLGNLLRNEQRTVEAEAAYRRPVKADPNFASAWHNLADLLDESGRLAEAVDCQKRALDADPQYVDAMFNLALYLQRLGEHTEATTWWRRYLEHDPHVVMGRTRETRIEILRNADGKRGIDGRRGGRSNRATLIPEVGRTMPDKMRIEVAPDQEVTALVYHAANRDQIGVTVILGHGAGADQRSDFMTRFATGLAARGINTVTFNFLYTEQGRRVPDANKALEACFRAVIEAVRHKKIGRGTLVIGGKSMGGRIASQIAAAGTPNVEGLVFLGYPLHPPGKLDQLRAKHLPAIKVPMLFVQGSRDTFGTPDELRPIIKELKAPVELYVVEGGDHSFKVLKRACIMQDDTYKAVLNRIESWLRQTFANR